MNRHGELIHWQTLYCNAFVMLCLCSVKMDPPSNFFFQLMLTSWMVTLSSCLIWQIISLILPPKEDPTIQCVFASLSMSAIDLQKMLILAKKNLLFRWSSFWSWRVCKQAKLLHLGQKKPARIHLKVKALKTSHCLVRILVQRLNWTICLWKWARRGCYSPWRSLSSHVERIFVRNN